MDLLKEFTAWGSLCRCTWQRRQPATGRPLFVPPTAHSSSESGGSSSSDFAHAAFSAAVTIPAVAALGSATRAFRTACKPATSGVPSFGHSLRDEQRRLRKEFTYLWRE